MRIAFTLLATILLAFGQRNVYGQKKFELADYAKFVNISDPQISPDGKSVVIVVSRPDYIQNRFNAELVLSCNTNGTGKALVELDEYVFEVIYVGRKGTVHNRRC
jgi:dipeptidyl aminopeptidase/acylaminoacyl peptidase